MLARQLLLWLGACDASGKMISPAHPRTTHYKALGELSVCAKAKGNFRLNAWWFGLLPLIRGFGFAFAIVVATDLPAAQVAIASVLLLAYVIAQAALQPWKARLINVMDMLLSATLLLLIRVSKQEGNDEQFVEVWTFCALIFLCFGLAIMLLASLTAMWAQRRGLDASLVLNMGTGVVAAEQMKALHRCAQALLEAAAGELESSMQGLNAYDLKQLSNAIEILDDVLATNFSISTSRLRMGGISKGFRPSVVDPMETSQPASSGDETNEQTDQEEERALPETVLGFDVVTRQQEMITTEC